MKNKHLNTFADVYEYLQETELPISKMNEITMAAIGCLSLKATTKAEFLNTLSTYWQKWQGHAERPPFMDDLNLDVKP